MDQIVTITTADRIKAGDMVQIANCNGRFSRLVWVMHVWNANDGSADICYRISRREAQVPRDRAVKIYNRKVEKS